MLREALAYWSFTDVEETLIDAAELWARSPSVGFGLGSGPWAADAPWQLLTREVRADINAEGLKRAEVDELLARAAEGTPPPRSGGLSREEVARRDQVSEWLRHVAEADRRLVVLAIGYQARSGRRVDWAWVMRQLGIGRGRDGLRMRYNRSITAIARVLTRDGVVLAA